MQEQSENERRQLSSKAPFVAGLILFALSWFQYSLFSGSSEKSVDYTGMVPVAILLLLGICAMAQGVYLQRIGAKTIEPARARHLPFE